MFATRCPLGSIKLTLLEPGAYIQPHVGGHNLKLRDQIYYIFNLMLEDIILNSGIKYIIYSTSCWGT